MRLKLVVIGILLIAFIFILSYNKSNKIKEKPKEITSENTIQNQEINDSKEVNIQELEQKLTQASYSSESEPIERSMEGSIEYVKEILPKDSKEIYRTYEGEIGVTAVTYKLANIEFEVRYMHPYKDDGKNNEFDLSKTAGIDLILK
ncbi:hypothetical protein UT300012_05520 [Paraclostridium bifermentans]|uniref:hypothetical protein n=1 Tax=Paraclostridium bifermentans TaxID=1490 RepID=UPI001C0FB80C|nr:hypothetical protein [Paraclostridium bifermentans]MBS5953006.1 hypothetical protein [Paraclostridium bifermentans]MBU5287481.1 hypothetical protein [Paraclostridium bifermentans]